LGNRTYKSSGNTRYVRGAFGEVLAVYNGSTLQYRNILRPDGTVIGRREGSNRLYYHRDHLGSTRAVANASGTVAETQDYYPFGLQMPGRSMTTGNSAREKFTSHELDSEVDLYYMIARRYAPEFGRFLSPDPHAMRYPEWSPYNYALNNPLIFIDPDGRDPVCVSRDADGFCTLWEEQEPVEVKATQIRDFRPVFTAQFVIVAARVSGQALVRAPNPYAIGAGVILLGGAIVADHFIESPVEQMIMQAKSESGADAVFPDESELARRLGIPKNQFEKKKHGEILKDSDVAASGKKLGVKNPDIGISREGTIVLKDRRTGKTIDTGVPLESFKD